jgi:hypothetical protein
MARRFIVILVGSNVGHQQRLTQHFSSGVSSGISWWHWSPEVWIVKFPFDRDLNSLREEVKNAAPGCNVLIFELIGNYMWAGYGPAEWQDWFYRYFDPSP